MRASDQGEGDLGGPRISVAIHGEQRLAALPRRLDRGQDPCPDLACLALVAGLVPGCERQAVGAVPDDVAVSVPSVPGDGPGASSRGTRERPDHLALLVTYLDTDGRPFAERPM